MDAEELLFIERKKKVRKKATIYLKIIFFTTILIIFIYLGLLIYNSLQTNNKSKLNFIRSNRTITNNRNNNIKLNNTSSRQKISNNQNQ